MKINSIIRDLHWPPTIQILNRSNWSYSLKIMNSGYPNLGLIRVSCYCCHHHVDYFPVDLVTFTEEILNGKLHFLCSGISRILKIDALSIISVLWRISTSYSVFGFYMSALFKWYFFQAFASDLSMRSEVSFKVSSRISI